MAGRPMLYPDKIVAPLVAGSKARIVAVLADGETTTDFLRTAVDTEIHRRERAMKRKKEDGA